MAREFTVRVYEDHYLISAEKGAGTVVAEKGTLEATLAMQDTAPEKKRTYPKGVRRQRKVKPEPEAAAQ